MPQDSEALHLGLARELAVLVRKSVPDCLEAASAARKRPGVKALASVASVVGHQTETGKPSGGFTLRQSATRLPVPGSDPATAHQKSAGRRAAPRPGAAR